MTTQQVLKPSFFFGLFLITLNTLLFQMLLTRIFSVTMWYHFAFVAVSLAMFGLTVGAMVVFLFPELFSGELLHTQISRASFLFSVTIVFSLLTLLAIPFRLRGLVGIYSLGLTYFACSIPFIFSGIVVCLALTKFRENLSRLYAVDLLGAGFGCILLIPLLHILDGPTAVIAVSAVTAVGSFCFAQSCNYRSLRSLSLVWAFFCFGFVIWHSDRVGQQRPVLSVLYVKGRLDPPPIYEKWNAFSAVRISADAVNKEAVTMTIDATAATTMVAFDGDFSKVKFLEKEAINLVHHLRPHSNVLVIGSGGGRDILSALYFKQKKIVGIEVNNVIIETLNKKFGNFSGNLGHYPNVNFFHDEARSYITRTSENFDIILANVVDTWAAGASGAFALTENSLYTVEAWVEYLRRLSDRGILTFGRWYAHAFPDEMYRLTGLAVEALKRNGKKNPRDHIVLVTPPKLSNDEDATAGILLVSNRPFTDKDLGRIDELCKKIPLELKLSPKFSIDENFAAIATGGNLKEFYRKFPVDIPPTTDDRPFFFQRHKLRHSFTRDWIEGKGLAAAADTNRLGVFVLGVLLIIMLILTLLTVLFPLLLRSRSFNFMENLPFLIFFASIGMGFMMIEISQLQRLSIFLGHPTYSLSVVLFSLLIGSGLGSLLTAKFVKLQSSFFWRIFPFVILLLLLLVFAFSTPSLIQKFIDAITPIRILISVMILFPLGLMMGMPFPIAMRQALIQPQAPAAWFWGINGVTSVYATVFAVAIAIFWGISISFYIGIVFYLIATIAFAYELKKIKEVVG